MSSTDQAVSQQLEQNKRRRELAEQQANPDSWDRNNPPPKFWESTHKYGEDVFNITEADRGELEGALGVIDRSELLLCETCPPREEKSAAATPNAREAFVRPLLDRNGWSITDWASNASVDHKTASSYLKGKKIFPNTRKKLANALQVESLPD